MFQPDVNAWLNCSINRNMNNRACGIHNATKREILWLLLLLLLF